MSKVMKMYVDIAKYDPLRARTYFPLPKFLENKKALVNVKNTDDQCLK